MYVILFLPYLGTYPDPDPDPDPDPCTMSPLLLPGRGLGTRNSTPSTQHY